MTEEINMELYKKGVSCNAYEHCIFYKSLKTDNARLKQENEKLKEENKELKGLLQDDGLCYVENCNKCKLAYVTDEKYRKALEEIKMIVSDEIDNTDSDDELMQIYGTIFNKIDEVLNEQ